MSIYDINGNRQVIETPIMPRENGFALDMQHVIAHKGGMWGAPLNSIYSFEIAFEKGFSIIEADVQVTSDNIPVITHDQTINKYARNSDGTAIPTDIYVHEHTYQELSAYDYGIQYGSQYAGLGLLTLDQLLLFCRRHGLSLQIDTDSTRNSASKAPLIYEMVKKRGVLEYVMFDCPDVTVGEAYAQLDTSLNLMIQGVENSTVADQVADQFNGRCRRLIAGTGISWTPNQAHIDYVHALGMLIKANKGDGHGGYVDFTPGWITKDDIRTLFDLGVDFYISDNISPGDVM